MSVVAGAPGWDDVCPLNMGIAEPCQGMGISEQDFLVGSG